MIHMTKMQSPSKEGSCSHEAQKKSARNKNHHINSNTIIILYQCSLSRTVLRARSTSSKDQDDEPDEGVEAASSSCGDEASARIFVGFCSLAFNWGLA